MQANRQEKHVRGCEGTVAGKGSHTIAFVRGLFPFSSLSLCSKFIIVVVFFLGLLVTCFFTQLLFNFHKYTTQNIRILIGNRGCLRRFVESG